jgi:hypothetical protein
MQCLSFLGHLLGGFQISGVTSFESGTPSHEWNFVDVAQDASMRAVILGQSFLETIPAQDNWESCN